MKEELDLKKEQKLQLNPKSIDITQNQPKLLVKMEAYFKL